MADLHTPGPWEVAETYADPGEAPETVIRGWGGRAGVAVALDFGANNPSMREANAALIAAAPELLEALEEIHQHAAGFIGTGQAAETFLSWAKKAREAIAKARAAAPAPATTH